MPVKNIQSIKYFLDRWDYIDPEYQYSVPYHESVNGNFTSLPTFVAEFHNCRVNSCPLLITMGNKLITNHVWGLTHQARHKPGKTHNMWKEWGDNVNVNMPKVTQTFPENYTYVWLPIDEASVNNPWHIWIDVISKFRLIEKRWSTDFSKYCFVLANYSPYFDKVLKELFPDIKVVVMPKNETWEFKHLLVPSMSNSQDGVTTPHLAPWLRHFKGLHGLKNVNQTKKIFVLRPGATSRRLVNSDEMLLALKGYETVVLEKMSIKDQMKTFAEASHIVAAHGAGLVNLLWCSPGTKVIEIQDRNMVHKKVYPVLSHHLGLKHTLLLADTIPIPLDKGKKPKGIKRLSDLIDFKVDITDLIRLLE